MSKNAIVRPLSRKDIFYSGSIYNLVTDVAEDDTKEKKPDTTLTGYRHSVVSIRRYVAASMC